MFDRLLNRRDQEAKIKSEGRLPPGQSLTQKFPVLHVGPVPVADLDTWDLKVFGEVEEEVIWDWEAFNKLPRTKVTMDLHCVTRWSKFDTAWEGVSIKTLIDEGFIKPTANANFVVQHCEFGYTTNTPLSYLLQDAFLLATHYEGEPLTPEHGYPLRGVAGAMADQSTEDPKYLWKGGKWLRGLEFRAEDDLGYWERNGYHNVADPFKEQRFSYQ